MEHLPRLSVGARRIAGLAAARPGRGVRAAQRVHGQYCGALIGDPTGCRAPDDEVDAVCCRHDVCYDLAGYNDCGCDLALVNEMPAAIAEAGGEAAVKGAAIAAFFAAKTCQCIPPVCVGPLCTPPVLSPTPFACPLAYFSERVVAAR